MGGSRSQRAVGGGALSWKRTGAPVAARVGVCFGAPVAARVGDIKNFSEKGAKSLAKIGRV